ncbi:hypothetical protein M011DRAFT_467518 [Sporormia fimetaria CBS 119925]|uniref:Uncharacterized protein n=1 Tax=Sporormia fimetaria CBS 119925 TaxID=1340428 RepID=A0A6A6VA67_9PLEO|nr:hypothetical protein M011DRAFT_467518 [Sporormia fimetaria CBS 119925]
MFRSSLLLAGGLATASAQFFDNHTIGSCVDVDCPPLNVSDSSTEAGCRVTNRTHSQIGLETFPMLISEDQGNLTWTIGLTVYDDADPSNGSIRVVEKDFYLGTPASLNFNENPDELPYQGCAIFIYGNNVTHPARNESWLCADVIGAQCMSSLLKDATAFLVQGARNGTESTEEACQRVQRGLNQTFSSGCGEVAGQESWNEIRAVPLTGPNAPQQHSESENSTSNCHPTLPKSNDLRFVYGYNDTGTFQSRSTVQMVDSVNLVLTMFWPPEGSTGEGDLQIPNSHLSCLWPGELNNESLRNRVSGIGSAVAGSMIFAGLVALVTSLILFT